MRVLKSKTIDTGKGLGEVLVQVFEPIWILSNKYKLVVSILQRSERCDLEITGDYLLILKTYNAFNKEDAIDIVERAKKIEK